MYTQFTLNLQQQLAAQQRAEKAADLERMEEEKRMMSTRAYQQWLLNKQLEEQQRKKEQRVEQEFKNLCEEQRKADQERARASFVSWKRRKDFERALSENNREPRNEVVETVGQIEPTPPLPGYCSVWSCDEQLAEQMLTRVQRPS